MVCLLMCYALYEYMIYIYLLVRNDVYFFDIGQYCDVDPEECGHYNLNYVLI